MRNFESSACRMQPASRHLKLAVHLKIKVHDSGVKCVIALIGLT
jgi:hypothetical protein